MVVRTLAFPWLARSASCCFRSATMVCTLAVDQSPVLPWLAAVPHGEADLGPDIAQVC